MILLLVAGANYECIYADIGTNSRVSDGRVWSQCSFAQKMNNDELCFSLFKCLNIIDTIKHFCSDSEPQHSQLSLKRTPQDFEEVSVFTRCPLYRNLSFLSVEKLQCKKHFLSLQ